MDLKEGKRVFVNSPFGRGYGTVTHVSDFFFCPIQVELDQPNEDGHKMVRFDFSEVQPEIKEVEPIEKIEKVEVEPEAVEVEPKKEKPPVNMIVRMVEKINGYSFEKGDVFAASEVGTKYNSCYYLYDPVTFELRGCMIKEAFELLETNLSAAEISEKAAIRNFVEKAVNKRIKTEREKVEKQPKQRKTVTKIVKPDKPENVEQMDIFSFL